MENINRIYESCFNEIVLHNYPKALESFQNGLREFPKQTPFLHGMIISYILLDKMDTLEAFLEKEKTVSPHRNLIEAIHMYCIDNRLFNEKPIDVIYNIALFIREHFSAADAKPYINIGQIIYPSHQRFIIAMAEYNIIEGNYTKGLKLYSRAAQLSKSVSG